MNINKNITVCFTGHRPQSLPWKFNENDTRCIEIKNKLHYEIINAINKGVIVILLREWH